MEIKGCEKMVQRVLKAKARLVSLARTNPGEEWKNASREYDAACEMLGAYVAFQCGPQLSENDEDIL